PELRYVKLFPERIAASNVLSGDGKKNPVVIIGAEGIVAVELLIDVPHRIVQFYALTSAVKGCGRQIVDAVVGATPEDWFLAVPMDWSGGFWRRMAEEYPRLFVCCVPLNTRSSPPVSAGASAYCPTVRLANGLPLGGQDLRRIRSAVVHQVRRRDGVM
ncbi:MAG: hypothetical protein WCA32_19200, partial [Chromatiaceae bacterium]